MNDKFNNYANVDTALPGEEWIAKSDDQRKALVTEKLQAFQGAEEFKVVQADKNGQIVIAIEKNIPANERGLYLLELEQTLKNNIDQGLHLWCEPVGDKSALRKLRGVVINT